MGFILLAPTKPVLDLLALVQEMIPTETITGDQAVFGHALVHLSKTSVSYYGERWVGYENRKLCRKPLCFSKSTTDAVAKIANLTVIFLPHTEFPRLCNQYPKTPIVSHCRLKLKTGPAKKRELNKLHYWFLDDEPQKSGSTVILLVAIILSILVFVRCFRTRLRNDLSRSQNLGILSKSFVPNWLVSITSNDCVFCYFWKWWQP